MKKIKWNWLDTVVVVVVLALVAGAAYLFLFNNSAEAPSGIEETEFYITFDTPKGLPEVFEPLENFRNFESEPIIYSTDTMKEIGTIEKVEKLEHKLAAFNENTKEYEAAVNDKYFIWRVTVKTKGYKNDLGEVFANGKNVVYGTEYGLEAVGMRFVAEISNIEGV